MSNPISATTRALRSIYRRARGDAGGAFRVPLHRDPSRRGGGRRDGHGRHDALGAGAPNGRGGVRAAGARLPRHPELPAGAGEDRWSILALPFIVVGSTLFAVLPGMEFAPLAAEAGGDVRAVQAALAPWFLPVLVTGAATFAIGVFAFANGIADSRILSRRLTWLAWQEVWIPGCCIRSSTGVKTPRLTWPSSDRARR